MMSINKIPEPDLKLLKLVLIIVILLLNPPNLQSLLFGLLLNALNPLPHNIIKINLHIIGTENLRALMMQCTFELMSILGSLAFGDQSYGEGVFALLVEVYDGVQGCEDVVVGEGGLQLGG